MVVLTALVGLAVLIAGLAGSVPAPQAVAVAVAVPSAHCAALLIRRGRRVEPSTGRRCRPTVLLGVGVAIGAASTARAGLAHRFAPDAMAADVPLPAEIPVAAGLLLIAGPVLTWYGVRAADGFPPEPEPVDGDGSYADYPLLVLPIGGALLAAAYHLVQGRWFDPVAVSVAIGGVAAVAAREALAVLHIRRYAARLAAQEAHFRSLVVGSTDVTIVLDEALTVRWQSPAAARQFGLSDQEVVGQPLISLVHPEDAERVAAVLGSGGGGLVEARLRDGYGCWRDTEWSLSDQRASPAVGALVVHARDVTERRELERTLHRAAYVDQLTGLPNRRELARSLPGLAGPGALMVIGLGGVAGVNEVCGHDVGDAVLVEAARRLRAGLTPADLPVRLGGGTFAVATPGGAVQAQLLATRLLTMLTEPYRWRGPWRT
jgi:PAS domain S-box-containing protein